MQYSPRSPCRAERCFSVPGRRQPERRLSRTRWERRSRLNPIDLSRIVLTRRFDASALMGYTGAVFEQALGDAQGLLLAAAVMCLWIMAPLLLARRAFVRSDFRTGESMRRPPTRHKSQSSLRIDASHSSFVSRPTFTALTIPSRSIRNVVGMLSIFPNVADTSLFPNSTV